MRYRAQIARDPPWAPHVAGAVLHWGWRLTGPQGIVCTGACRTRSVAERTVRRCVAWLTEQWSGKGPASKTWVIQ